MRVAFIALVIACGVVIKFWFFQPAPSSSDSSTSNKKSVVNSKTVSTSKAKTEAFNGVLTLPEPELSAAEQTESSPAIATSSDAEKKEATIAPEKVLRKIPIIKSKLAKKQKKTAKPSTKKKKVKKAGIQSLFEQTTTPSQFFRFSNIKNSVLKGQKGTLLSIPENSFVQKDGKTVKGEITLELKEVFSCSDMLLANLATASEYGTLISDGAIYINSTDAEGNALVLPKNKSIYVETPTPKRDGKMWVFYGDKQQTKAPTQWVAHKQQMGHLLPIPLKNLKYDELGLDAKWYAKLTSSKYENTVIATREFRERLKFILDNRQLHGNRTNTILSLCLQNAKRSLLDIDYKLHKYFKNLHSVAKKESAEGLASMKKQFLKYQAEQLGKTININTYGLDFDQQDAYKVFIQKGFDKKYTSLLLQMNTLQQALIADPLQTLATESKNTFPITRTGWLNIDRFYNKKSKPKALIASINEQPKDLDMKVYLSFKNFKSLLPARKDEAGNYHFAGLPEGEEAYLIGIGYQNEQPYIDVVSLTVGAQEKAQLSMRPTTLDMLNYQVSKLDYHH